jgi:hypothetical protein
VSFPGLAVVDGRRDEDPLVVQTVVGDVANQYSIGYTSKNLKKDGAWRAIVVRVNRPNTAARTKRGYFAPTIPRTPTILRTPTK